MRFFSKPTDEDMAKAYAQDITDKANKLIQENEDKENALRLKVIKASIEKQAFVLFFNSPNLGFTIYAPSEKAETAQDIVRSIMAAMHIREENEESYKANKGSNEHRPEIR